MSKVLVIGPCCLDIYKYGHTAQSPDGPHFLFREIAEEQYLGCAGNICANLRALGHEVFLYSTDTIGTTIKALLDNLGVQILFPRSYKFRGDHIKDRFCSENKRNTILRVDEPFKTSLRPQVYYEDLLRLVVEYPAFDAYYIADYGPFVPEPEDIEEIIEQIHYRHPNKPVFIDSRRKLFLNADYIKTNKKEYGRIESEDIKVLSKVNAPWVFCTYGCCGNILYTPAGNPSFYIPGRTQEKDVINTCGAGDVAFCVFLTLVLQNYNLRSIPRICHNIATETCKLSGTCLITPEIYKHFEELVAKIP